MWFQNRLVCSFISRCLQFATAKGAGNEILQPLAIVVLGGLFTSTALTLLVIPALYARFGKYLIPKQKSADREISFPLNPDPQYR